MKKRLLTAMVVLTGMFLLTVSIVWAAPVPLAKTGQTTLYRTGDDGDHEKGVASPSPRFTDNGDGTVTDNLTGLMWAQNANLNNGTMTWNAAIDYANGLSLGTNCGTPYTDWRLPNIKELQSLIDYGKHEMALPSGHPFTNVLGEWYWSSTTNVDHTNTAWSVDWSDGSNNAEQIKTISIYVWSVRGGN